jgi:hypothetical protein
MASCLGFRSTRTLPALFSAHSLLLAYSASLTASVQAVPVSFIARHPETIKPRDVTMSTREISKLLFTTVYPLYVQKAERKNRTKEEVDTIICWLTGYSREQLGHHTAVNIDFQGFFDQAPAIHPNSSHIKGVVCGIRVEDIQDPITQKIRYLDKLMDELAKGKSMDKILRQ